MTPARHSKARLERFSHPVPKRVHKERTFVKDASSHDFGLVVTATHDVLRDALHQDSLQLHYEEAQEELKDIKGVFGNTAWDDLASFIPEFGEKELKIREELRARYRHTDAWSAIELRLQQMDVETKAVLRSVIRVYTMDHVYSNINASFRSGNSVKYRGYSSLLREARWVAPYFMEEKAFRGTMIDDAEEYREGLVYEWPFFVSASGSESLAATFGPVLFIIDIPSEFSIPHIKEYSLLPDEDEVLFHPYTRFKVLERRRDRINVIVH